MDSMQHRPATRAEVAAAYDGWKGKRVQYEHWAREVYAPRSATGARRITKATGRVHIIGGVAHVRYRGDLHELKATHYTMQDGKTFIALPTIR